MSSYKLSCNMKLFACCLNLFILFCVISEGKTVDYDISYTRFFDIHPGMQMISERYCKTACGQSTRFLISLELLKKFCQMKCPNSTLANLALGNAQNATTTGSSSKPELTTAQPSTTTQSTATTTQPSNGASAQSTTTPVPETDASGSGESGESAEPAVETSKSTIKRETTVITTKTAQTLATRSTPAAIISTTKASTTRAPAIQTSNQ